MSAIGRYVNGSTFLPQSVVTSNVAPAVSPPLTTATSTATSVEPPMTPPCAGMYPLQTVRLPGSTTDSLGRSHASFSRRRCATVFVVRLQCCRVSPTSVLTYVLTTTLHPSPVTEVAITPPHAVSPPTGDIKVRLYGMSSPAAVMPLHSASDPSARLKVGKLNSAPALAVAASASVISVTPSANAKQRQPSTSNSPETVFYGVV